MMFNKKIRVTEDEWSDYAGEVVQDAMLNFEPEERERFVTYALYFSFLLMKRMTEKDRIYRHIVKNMPIVRVSDVDEDVTEPIAPISINEISKKDRQRILEALKELFDEDDEE